MFYSYRAFTRIIILIVISLSANVSAKIESDITDRLKNIESDSEGRLGIFAINTENGHIIKYRSTEVFPAGCTSKLIGVAALLKKSMSDPSILSRRINYSQKDIDFGGWSPITEKHIQDGMTIKDLSSAAISLSDNTAMNLLLNIIGGIDGMNDFARSIGDFSFRQDNDWPKEAYSGGFGNVKDSSTPQSMVESLRKILLGETLARPQRDLLTSWMINTQTGLNRIRSKIPSDWIIGNKTGTGGAYGSTNDLAIAWPPNHAPILIGIFYTSNNKKAETREDLVSVATKILVEEFTTKDPKLK